MNHIKHDLFRKLQSYSSKTKVYTYAFSCEMNQWLNLVYCWQQKRGRYKKMIRVHMDLDTIRSKISTNAIKSRMELYRDLLLLTNNALVFYSKTTREYKSALLLRDLVTKKLRQNPQTLKIKTSVPTQQEDHTHTLSVKTQVHSIAPVKPRSVRPGNRKIVAAKVEGSNSASGVSVGASKKSSPAKLRSESSPFSVDSLAVKKKKGIGRPKKVGRGNTAGQAPVMAVKGKRRVRAKWWWWWWWWCWCCCCCCCLLTQDYLGLFMHKFFPFLATFFFF